MKLNIAIIIVAVITFVFVGVTYNLMSTPCAEEDSLNCVWDASVQGNGVGQSYINISNDFVYAQILIGE